jgi:hypothetical protein
MKPAPLRITSCMADNAEATCRAITVYLGEKPGIATRSAAWRNRLTASGSLLNTVITDPAPFQTTQR